MFRPARVAINENEGPKAQAPASEARSHALRCLNFSSAYIFHIKPVGWRHRLLFEDIRQESVYRLLVVVFAF